MMASTAAPMVDSRLPGALPAGHLSFFSVLGGAITRAALQQVQRDVDVISSVSASLRGSPLSGDRSAPAPASKQPSCALDNHPLQRVLNALRAAHVSSSAEKGNDEGRPKSESTYISARDALIDAFGVSVGSSLYRDWVQAPRRRIRRIVHGLAATVRERYLPVLAECDAFSKQEGVDVHVQLYPSAAIQQTVVPEALKESLGFFAAVTVRRLSALEDEVAATRRLRQRYMDVAAQGQTLSTALSFWADVSYGDAPPPALMDYPPLGFEEESHRLTSKTVRAGGNLSTAGSDRQRGRKAQRATDEEDDVGQPALLLGVEEDPVALAVVSGKGEVECVPEWLQPPQLLWSNDELGDRQLALVPSSDESTPVSHLRYASVGLLAVVYVHTSGMAYVGYPQCSGTSLGNTSTDISFQPHSNVPAASSSPVPSTPLPQSQQPCLGPIYSLPMSSSTGFVRSLLGLS